MAESQPLRAILFAASFPLLACTHDVALTSTDAGADAPAEGIACVEGIPCCPEDLNTTGQGNVVTIRYPTTIVRSVSSEFPAVSLGTNPVAVDFDGTLSTVMTIPTPATEDCVERFVTSPPSNPCAADTMIQIDRAALSPARFLVGLPSSELTAFAGMALRVHIEQGRDDQSYPDDHLILAAQRTDGAALFVATSISLDSESGGPARSWTFGQFNVTRGSAPFCVSSLMGPCMRTFEADDLVVTVDGISHTIHPTETTMLTTALGRYRITHRAITRRNDALRPGTVTCSDVRPDHWSFEIVRIGD